MPKRLTRRGLCRTAAMMAAFGNAGRGRAADSGRGGDAMGAIALRVKDVRTGFRDHRYRAAYQFGGVPVDRATLLDVESDVETAAGRVVTGTGSCPWATSGPSRPATCPTGRRSRR